MAQGPKTPVIGRLTDAQSKAPIAGAQVKLGNANTLTDENGQFQLGKFPQGNYSLSISSLGYKTYQNTVAVGNKALDLSLYNQPHFQRLN